jgi:hemerythrin-like domain-containing protein
VNELCIRHLLREHREVERAVRELEEFLIDQSRRPAWGPEEREDFDWILSVFEKHLERHVRKEEEVLFPALEASLPRDLGPLAVLRGEHEDLRQLCQRLRAAGELRARGSQDPAVTDKIQHFGGGVIQVLRDHIYKEDRVLFPMASRFLSAEQDGWLLKQMEAVDLHGEAPGPVRPDQTKRSA